MRVKSGLDMLQSRDLPVRYMALALDRYLDMYRPIRALQANTLMKLVRIHDVVFFQLLNFNLGQPAPLAEHVDLRTR